jgi:hypothetical protein
MRNSAVILILSCLLTVRLWVRIPLETLMRSLKASRFLVLQILGVTAGVNRQLLYRHCSEPLRLIALLVLVKPSTFTETRETEHEQCGRTFTEGLKNWKLCGRPTIIRATSALRNKSTLIIKI